MIAECSDVIMSIHVRSLSVCVWVLQGQCKGVPLTVGLVLGNTLLPGVEVVLLMVHFIYHKCDGRLI